MNEMEIPKENKDPRSLLNEKLFDAARAGSSQEVKKFIEDGASTDGYKNTYGLTALMMAAGRGQDECVRQLLTAAADVDMTSNNGETALMMAAEYGRDECLSQLLAAKADVNMTGSSGETALMNAAYNGQNECVRQLLAAKADFDMANEDGGTALMRAAGFGRDECVRQLLAAKADVDMTDNYGRTALMKAVMQGKDECVRQLLAAKADVDMTDEEDGYTALHYASYGGHTAMVQQLLGISKTSLNKKDNGGKTPLRMAREWEHESTIAVLRAAGATEESSSEKSD